MRVAVIGAGIGGLTVSAGLCADGHEVVVYEHRDNPGAVGAGLTLFGNAFGALDAIGLGETVRNVSSDATTRMRAGQRTPVGDWLVSMPLPDDRVYWFATETTAAGQRAEDERDAVRDRFGSWHSPILACIDATPANAVLRHDIYDLDRIPASFTQGRTVLLGDAAHSMTPNLGQGAGQAIEDAATLILLLRSGDLHEALGRYDALRRKRTRAIWRQSRLMGKVAGASHPVGAGVRDALLRMTPIAVMGSAMQRIQRWSAP